MIERFENIMSEEGCVKPNEAKEENKTKRFDKFMEAQAKKIKLQEKKIDAKILTMKIVRWIPRRRRSSKPSVSRF